MKLEAKQRLAADVHQGIIPRLMGWIQEVLHAKFEESGTGTYHMHTKANAEQAIRRYMSIEDLMGRSGAKAQPPKLEPHGVTFEFDLSEENTPQAGQGGQTLMAVTFTQEGLYVAVRVASQGIPVQPQQQQQQGQRQGQQPPQQQEQLVTKKDFAPQRTRMREDPRG